MCHKNTCLYSIINNMRNERSEDLIGTSVTNEHYSTTMQKQDCRITEIKTV